jgi:hypothetical protein
MSLNQDQQAEIRRMYLAKIRDDAERISVLADKLIVARAYRDLTGTEFGNAINTGDLTLEEANVVNHFPAVKSLEAMEDQLEAFKWNLQNSYEMD